MESMTTSGRWIGLWTLSAIIGWWSINAGPIRAQTGDDDESTITIEDAAQNPGHSAEDNAAMDNSADADTAALDAHPRLVKTAVYNADDGDSPDDSAAASPPEPTSDSPSATDNVSAGSKAAVSGSPDVDSEPGSVAAPPGLTVKPASFKGVEPGASTRDDLDQAWVRPNRSKRSSPRRDRFITSSPSSE